MKRKTIEEFIADARKVHGDRYDYSKTEYTNSRTKVCITCKIHGDFYQKADVHIRGAGCPKCGAKSTWDNRGRTTTDNFVTKSVSIHGDKYDYSKSVYKSSKRKVVIICQKHGEFKMTPNNHLLGHGCPICRKENLISLRRKTKEEFVDEARQVHKDKYDYSLVEYINMATKVKIICPIHGVFEQEAGSHLSGSGCPDCAKERMSLLFRSNAETFIEKARKVHGNLYNYEKVKYINSKKNVDIICYKHGVFHQTPYTHLSGAGCPMCSNSRGEEAVAAYLESRNITYIRQYVVKNESLFCNNKIMKIDFYVQPYNTFIEFNGEQHYIPKDCFGGEKDFVQRQERDFALKQYCYMYHIKLIVIPYTDIKKIPSILGRRLKKNRNSKKI